MSKKVIRSIAAKNAVIANITEAMVHKTRFLILGHRLPDEDCIASMVAFALLARLFDREPVLYLDGAVHEHFQYLLSICRYNSIPVASCEADLQDPEDRRPDVPAEPSRRSPQGEMAEAGAFDAVVLCDTPKPSMIGLIPRIQSFLDRPGVLRIEIDHHLGADSEYFGDEGYRLVTEASSTSELVGHLLLKLGRRCDLLERFQIADLYSRNIVLAILTGIIGDSKMGRFLNTRREKRYFRIFSTMFNDLLARKTTKRSNFSNMEQVFRELQRLSSHEERCFGYILERKRLSASVGYVSLGEADMAPLYAEYDEDTVVAATRIIADRLAEDSGRLSLVAYADNPKTSDLVQFRVRRASGYKKYDLRQLLPLFSIRDGGGHEGAIGFRLKKSEVGDLDRYVDRLIGGIEAVMPA
jgi:nanoRNase/pAp phosphatase (c-di-AMP/oligoRNAs hydrolase)